MFDMLSIFFAIALVVVGPIAVIVLIVKMITNKKDDINQISDFEKTVRYFYVYSILIISFCMLVMGCINAFSTGLNILLPDMETSSRYTNTINEYKVEFATSLAVTISGAILFAYHSNIAKKMGKAKRKIKNIAN